MPTDSLDLTLYGATSFVGQILTRYLWQRHGQAGSLRFALAGRSQAKLEALRASLGDGAQHLPLLVADAADDAALTRICKASRAVVSTVGPYALYGEPLVRACAQTGTDYCDLTGEPQWIRRMLDLHGDQAQRSGARIVHCCGFDSIPSDLGVAFLQHHAQARYGAPATEVSMRVKAARGGFSGGTIASMLNAVKEATQNPELRRELANPYSLCGPGAAPKTRQRVLRGAAYDRDHQAWIAPFVMAPINTRIVQRSHSLLGRPWSDEFRYDEAMIVGRGLKGRASANLTATGISAFMLASALAPTRYLLERFVLPAPGDGPSPAKQEAGFFDLRFVGRTADGELIRAKVTGDRDPGYGSTAKMLGEAAALLAVGLPKSARAGGFWTPSTAFGLDLIRPLAEHAGLRFELLAD